MNEEELHAYLLTQFNDLAGAKKFMRRWAVEMDQMLPGRTEISSRALAAHYSAVLEGGPVSGDEFFTNYMGSKYGTELLRAAWSD